MSQDNPVHVGTPNSDCAGCRKPFNDERRPAVLVTLPSPVPMLLFGYSICLKCASKAQKSMAERHRLFERVHAFHMDDGSDE